MGENQVSTLQNSIYATNQQLIQKRDELERLKETLAQLEDYQEEFQVNKRHCFYPELSKNTWSGQLATQFHEFRSEGLQTSYQSIIYTQLERTMSQLVEKIQETKALIGDLQCEHASKNTQLSDLKTQLQKGYS